jgi:hypothetical protein
VNSFSKEVLPEERLAKVVLTLVAMGMDFKSATIMEVAAKISPYMQLEILDAQHQERVLCLSDFYNLREKLMQRERESFQKKSELFLQITSRPEAGPLGMRIEDTGKV